MMTASTLDSQESEQREDIDALVDLGECLIENIFSARPLEDVKALVVDQDAPLWYQDESGNSALHAAAYTRNKELVDFLLERGAIWNASESLYLFCAHELVEQ